MGKKNKSRDIWDLTPEQQAKQTEELYKLEKGEIDILSISNITNGIDENGFSMGLQKEITKDLLGRKDENKEEPKNTVSLDSNIEDEISKEENVNVDNSQHVMIRTIKSSVIDVLNRLKLDDGIAPTSYSFDIGLNQDIVGSYDVDEATEMICDLWTYIISLKHPTAIYRYDDFINTEKWKFSYVIKDGYDHDQFAFFRVGNYVLCYMLEKDCLNHIMQKINASDYQLHEMIKTFISLSYAVGTLNQAFFVEDVEYVNTFMNSELNQQNEFHKLFIDENDTSIRYESTDIEEDDGIYFIDLPEIQTYVRGLISRLTNTSYFGDDDDYEDDDDYDIDEEIIDDNLEETTDETVVEEIDDTSDLLITEMEEVDTNGSNNIDKIEPSSDDNFVVPVVRKK